MKIGLIDCDKKNSKNPFPNLALMKISAWHKSQGDVVEWHDPLFGGHYDKSFFWKYKTFEEYIEKEKETH